MRFNNPLEIGWQLHALDAIMILINVVAVLYSIRQYRCGRPTYLVLWLSALFYGIILEFTTGMLISRSYIQGEFTAMLTTGSIPGYKTDMPFYILLLYPAINFLGFKLIESFGIRSILARAMSAGVFAILIDAPYVVNGPLSNVRWWQWLDWTLGGRHMFQYWYGWPMADAMWELTWPPLLMWLVWQWERRRAESTAEIATVKRSPLKTLIGFPLLIGLLVNTGGILLSFPIGIAIGFDLPHYPFVLAVALLLLVVLLYSDKQPVGLDRVGWILLAIHVVGYAIVTVANFAHQPVPAGQIVIVTIALVVTAILASYPGYRWRRQGSIIVGLGSAEMGQTAPKRDPDTARVAS
ncbi:hypothetical protein A5634_15320 [Mycobacterium asiaticum]|uniref:Carotenoid biosynthesis protein n=1 Tax=Mycobacterium asiaticum TaxID=1790 RepID=A0A1A3P923_MYCAS|nr:hypothetical protein [Mycobacterium asiaticum]OBK30661.1 hypothetical protein A5634_15320 [Mycobacterium asiaticum]